MGLFGGSAGRFTDAFKPVDYSIWERPRGNSDIGGGVSMGQFGAPQQPPRKPGLFGQGGVGRSIAGNIGDVLLQYANMQPVYAPMVQAQQEEARWGKRLEAQDKQWYDHQQYEAAHPKPVNNDTVADYQFILQTAGEEAARQFLQNKANPPQYRQGPDGQFYRIETHDAAQGVPTAPVGRLTPIEGGAVPGMPPFADSSLTAITAQSESGNRDYLPNGRPVTSPKGARFAMQVMPATAHDPGFGVRPVQNETAAEYDRVGRDYQAAMLRRYGGDPAKMWGAYNGGPGRLDRSLAHGTPLPTETRNYVARNMRALKGH